VVRLTIWLARDGLRFKRGSRFARLLVEQLRDLPNGDHDDVPEALEMAICFWPRFSILESLKPGWFRHPLKRVYNRGGGSPGTLPTTMTDVTRILSVIEQGDAQAAQQLLPLVYNELRQLAAQRLSRERPGQTLQATALVHEAYLRLLDTNEPPGWNSRAHFFAAAAEVMRRILVEGARRKSAAKRGGLIVRCEAELDQIACQEPDEKLLLLDEALTRLASHDPRKAELVKLRYFAGLTIQDAAELLGISTATADRDWAYARAWLQREIDSAAE
jgi:RNA polymerase sigma factor (TIGR02999 family)